MTGKSFDSHDDVAASSNDFPDRVERAPDEGLAALISLADATDVATSDPLTHVDRYYLLEVIGKGGMGTVYKAEQRHPIKRTVAVKVIKTGFDSEDVIARFNSERQILARMDHPNVARVIDAGLSQAGTPYFVMEYVPGEPILQFCDSHHLTVHQRLDLFLEICDAVSHAHTKATIHRDLKSSNVLAFVQDGKHSVKVIDFGIAKALVSDGPAGLTRYTSCGEVLGTYESMSPEQAEGSPDIDTRTDVYSLGVLLYELLTGNHPSDLKSRPTDGIDARLRRIRTEDPPWPSTCLGNLAVDVLEGVSRLRESEPRKLSRLIRGDLDWIVMKSLEKDRARRYASVSEFGADIKRYLNSEPIVARPQTAYYRFGKFVRRNRIQFASAAAVMLVIIIGAAVSVWQALRATRAEAVAVESRQIADARADDLRRNVYQMEMNLGGQIAESLGSVVRIRELLAKWKSSSPDLRGWEWYYLNGLCNADIRTLRGHSGRVRSVAFSPDGSRIASASADKTIRIWEASTGRELLVLKGHQAEVNTVAWNPDSKQLVSASTDETVGVWDTSTGARLLTLDAHSGALHSAVWDAEGTRLAAAGDDGTITIWDGTGGEIRRISSPTRPIEALAWSSNGAVLVSSTSAQAASEKIEFWDVATGRRIRAISGLEEKVMSVEWSPDGERLLAAGYDPFMGVWDAAAGNQPIWRIEGHRGQVDAARFSPDGKRIASGSSFDRTLKIWDAIDPKEAILTFRGHEAKVNSVAWSPDGRLLASGSDDGTVKIWDASGVPEPLCLRGHTSGIDSVSWSPDGRHLVAGDSDATAIVWDSIAGKSLLKFHGHKREGNHEAAVAWSPDGARIASVGGDGIGHVWEPFTGAEHSVLRGHVGTIHWVAWSPDSSRLATAGLDDMTVRIWNAQTGENLLTLRGHTAAVWCVEWSPDGRRVASAGLDGTIRLWNPADGSLVSELSAGADKVESVSWSPDGARLAASGVDQTIRIWDLASGKVIRSLRGHALSVYRVNWSPDGRRLASGSSDGTTKIWDPQTGAEVMSLRDGLGQAVWSPDGKRLAAAATENRILIYNATRGYDAE